MTKIQFTYPILGVLMLLLGCKSLKPQVENRALPELLVSADSTKDTTVQLAPEYFNLAPLTWDIVHTKLKASFSFKEESMKAVATLTVTPHFLASNELTIDAVGFYLKDEIYFKQKGGKKRKAVKYEYADSSHLVIQFDTNFNTQDTLELEINYVVKPSTLLERGLISSDDLKGMFFINPKLSSPSLPRQIWTQGETQTNSMWLPTLENPMVRMSQEFYLTVDTPFQAISNGRLVYYLLNPDGTRTYCWKQNRPHAPYLSMLVVGKFAITEANWKNVPLMYFTDFEYAKYAPMIFGKTPEIIEFLSNKLNQPFAWDKLAHIPVQEFVSGAMENTSAITYLKAIQQDSASYNDNSYESYIVHETAHQWFGDLLTCKNWGNTAMNESFATYSEYLWYEHKGQKTNAAEKLRSFRTDYFLESRFAMHPLVYHQYQQPDDMFDAHSYEKGALVLHTLRAELGDALFFGAIQRYIADNKDKSVDIESFKSACEWVSGRSLDEFFNQWVYASGHPVLSVKYTSLGDTALKISMDQLQWKSTGRVYSMKPTVNLYLMDGTTLNRPISTHKSHQEFFINLPSALKSMSLSWFDYPLVECREEKEFGFWFNQMNNSMDYQSSLDAAKYLLQAWPMLDSNQKNDLVNKITANISLHNVGMDLINVLNYWSDAAFPQIKTLLQSSNNELVSNSIRYLKGYNLIDVNELLKLCERQSTGIRLMAIGNALELDFTRSFSVSKRLLFSTHDEGLQRAILSAWSAKGDLGILAELERFVFSKSQFINYYFYYVKRLSFPGNTTMLDNLKVFNKNCIYSDTKLQIGKEIEIWIEELKEAELQGEKVGNWIEYLEKF